MYGLLVPLALAALVLLPLAMATMQVTRKERFDREATITQALAADRTLQRFAGPKRPGMVGWRVLRVLTDKGVLTGAAIDTVSFKALPDQQPGLMGGDRQHSFAATDNFNRNSVEFGQVLWPGEDLVLDWNNGTAARSIQARVEAEILYGYAAPQGGVARDAGGRRPV